jgi:hypothetical protein
MGGLVIEIADRYIDMSLSSKIKAYSDLIKQSV